MNYRERYNQWINDEFFDEATRKELVALRDEKEIEDRFYRDLEFGTGGLRGVMGAGTNRMNKYTVGKATTGLGRYLLDTYGAEACKKRGVVIGYDTRNNSEIFSHTAAKVLSGMGIRVYLHAYARPTPQLSFSINFWKALAGVVVTASHNPKEYNGYKVYDEYGCQLVPWQAKQVIQYVEAITDYHTICFMGNDSLISMADVTDNFVTAVLKQSRYDNAAAKKNLKIVYTPLHGTGNVPIRKALRLDGFTQIESVADQVNPDGDFPTVVSPNPEDRRALELGIAQAKRTSADIVLGTDPDCDRVGIAVRTVGGYHLLTGNQVGALLMNFILTHTDVSKYQHPAVVKTVVTSELGADIARRHGITVFSTLTGFKFIGEKITQFEQAKRNGHKEQDYDFLFLQHLKYVVFDEIHFLYADATFNADASILLTELPKIFRSVIRIYMTATSWSVRNSLLYAEQNAGCGNSTYLPISGQIGEKKLWADPHDHQNSTFYHYQMVGNYDAYRLHFFNRHGDCTDAESYDPDDDPYLEDKDDAKVKKGKNIPALDALINLFPNPSLDRKLLIFVKQKKHGQYLAKYYKEAGIHARFVDSSYRALASEYRKAQAAPKPIKPKVTIYKPGEGEFNTQIAAPERIFDPEELEKIEFWNLFIDKEGDFSKEKKEVKKRYDFAVLIATSVLDCGINIKNEAIRDIVIFADDPTAFMQMLGRKRLPKNCEEKVNLWVYIPPRQNFSTQAQTKQLEIELGEKVLLVQKHTTISKQTQKPDYLRNVFNSNGQFMDAFYAKVESWQTTLHTGALDNELAKKYPGTTHKSIDNELVRNYQRITDKALFHRDPAGHVFCNKYVLWIIRQQLAYYQSFLQEENPLVFRDEVCKWLGRYEEIKKKQDQAKRAIIDFLQKYDGRLIEDTNEIDNLRVLAYNAAQICLDKNPLPYNFKKIYGKTLSKALKLLGIQYTVTSIKGEFHQKTKWLVEVGWKEATE